MKKLLLGMLAILFLTGCTASTIPEFAVYTFNGETVTADEYYTKISELYGTAFMYQLLENLVVGDLELSDEDKETAQTQYEKIVDYYSDDESKAYLDAIVKAAGYSGSEELLLYIENGIRKQNYINDYIDAHFDDAAFIEKLTPKKVKHVLVMFDDSGSFTAATQMRIEEIDKILATENPENLDTILADLIDGTSIVYEDLGYTDVNTSFEAPFLKAALALNKGELSGWVETTYGYHRIYVYGDSFEDFKGDAGYHSAVTTYDSTIENKAMWALLQETVTFTADFEAKVKAYLEIED